jgi:leucyl aminopeptidase
LVGKGVIFDTGGLNLKPADGMLLMKKDMGGAAVTLALADLIMKQKLPVRLRLMIPAVENSPGRNAFRPSDVIETRKGIHVEIGNTDAEGRLFLCDPLYEAAQENPDWLIDVATLTGAARVALGQDLPAFYTDSEEIAGSLREAATEAADPVWRMPLWHPYREKLESHVSHMNNMANSPMAGSITAALYLHEFVKPFVDWVHLDAYCWRQSPLPGSPKGGEASALRTLFRAIENRYRPQ